MGFLREAPTPEELEQIKQQRQSQLDIARLEKERTENEIEKRALIAEAKKRYGKDWTKFFSGGGKGRGSGIDWQALKFRVGR